MTRKLPPGALLLPRQAADRGTDNWPKCMRCLRAVDAYGIERENDASIEVWAKCTGARIDHSQAGLYLWVTRDEDCWATIDWLAGLGIVAAPGTFYGPAGERHVRMALTATDERIDAAVERLTA